MKIDILTLFPQMFKGPFAQSIIQRAVKKKQVEIKIHDLRKWAQDKHKTVDARPYGGGPGMILMIEPMYKALKSLKKSSSQVILLTPQGKVFKQKRAEKIAQYPHIILICGHYEGVDERIRKHLVDWEISIGDYILTGGEIPAMVVVDAVVRLLPGVLKKPEAISNESFTTNNLLEYPQYTRPEKFKNWSVPKILVSGHHQKINKWRKKQAKLRTKKRRPDLITNKAT